MISQICFPRSRRPFRMIALGSLLAAVWWGAATLGDFTGWATLSQSLWVTLGGFGVALMIMGLFSARRRSRPQKVILKKFAWSWALLAALYPLAVMVWLVLDLAGQALATNTLWITRPVFVIFNLTAVLLIGPLADLTGLTSRLMAWARQAFPRGGGKFLLGLIWWLWHLPFIFVNGTALARLHFSGLWLALYLVTVLGISYIFTWGYDKKRRDVLSTAFKHF